ncbi:hypothetical protein L596_017200 [Steinernema carpocapsae]|uniref:Uncharacterized protein n=1 Tax=Steinernema carpocapsae TaxID=34508 RepID=A0A4U5N0X4_STECR|nr:hypothetical protein L596_017200 [Steinernema carpocapsae]
MRYYKVFRITTMVPSSRDDQTEQEALRVLKGEVRSVVLPEAALDVPIWSILSPRSVPGSAIKRWNVFQCR